MHHKTTVWYQLEWRPCLGHRCMSKQDLLHLFSGPHSQLIWMKISMMVWAAGLLKLILNSRWIIGIQRREPYLGDFMECICYIGLCWYAYEPISWYENRHHLTVLFDTSLTDQGDEKARTFTVNVGLNSMSGPNFCNGWLCKVANDKEVLYVWRIWIIWALALLLVVWIWASCYAGLSVSFRIYCRWKILPQSVEFTKSMLRV